MLTISKIISNIKGIIAKFSEGFNNNISYIKL